MRKSILLAALLLLVPASGQAQQSPDTTRADRPMMRGRMGERTPEMRRAHQRGVREGRMAGRARMHADSAAPMGRGMRAGGAGRNMIFGPSMRAQLELTDEQVRQLDAIRTQQRELHRPRMEALRNDREKWQQQRDLFQQQTRALMLEVLTPAQRTKLEELEKQGQAQRG